MKVSTIMSLAAATVLLTVGASAHHGHGHGVSARGHGGGCGMGGGFDFGADENGMHICIYGFSPVGNGEFNASVGDHSANCQNNQFDFTYQVHGGFAKDSAHADSPNMKPGRDDQTQDGFWYREGPFSAPVAYGDLNNDGKRYSDTSDAYPAWTWGHPEADPFVSPGGAGDNLGGASGVGSTGFTAGLNADDNGTFYPYSFFEVNNIVNSFKGSYSSDLSWNVKLYDKQGNKVYDHTFTNTLYYWETVNVSLPKYNIICPRESVNVGETVNDFAFNQKIHDEVTSHWAVYGMNVDFVSDGGADSKACSDPITLKEKEMSDTFETGPRWNKKTYKVTLDGPYLYDSSVEGCPALNDKGLPDTDGAWDAKCFKKVDTIWVEENSKARAFMRLKVEKEDNGWF